MGNMKKSSLSTEVKLLKAEMLYIIYNKIMNCINNFSDYYWAVFGLKFSAPLADPGYRGTDYRGCGLPTVRITEVPDYRGSGLPGSGLPGVRITGVRITGGPSSSSSSSS
jgi:hypothetical protein